MKLKNLKTARPVASLRQGRTEWYRIQNHATATDTTQVYLFDEIGWFGVTAQDFVHELNAISTGTIELHLNTPGGDAFDGVAILNALRSHSARVVSIVDGLAASAGSFIAQAGDERVMMPNSTMMIHEASGLCIGNAADMQQCADLLSKLSDNIASVYADRSGRGAAGDWREFMHAETWYDAQEAVDAGLADRVGQVDSATEAPATDSWDLSIFAHAGRREAPSPTIMPARSEPALTVDPAEFRAAIRKAMAHG